MKRQIKKYNLIITLCLFGISIFLTNKVVNADSGWDSSYDSSSSWDSGSSWDSSSSWDYDSSWSGSGAYAGGDLGDTDLMIMIMFVVIMVVFIMISARKPRSVTTSKVPVQPIVIPEGLSYDQIKAIDPSLDKELLKEQTFHIYQDVQHAWMNFDYETLRKNLTDEIYNMYESQLKTLKIKNQKNIMKDIQLKKVDILSINIENNIEEIKVYLNVSQYDYVVDKDNKVLRGTDKYKNSVEYMITFVRHIDHKKIEKCPNCGAPIDIISGGVCPYCDSTIINNNDELIMSKKECIGQRREY